MVLLSAQRPVYGVRESWCFGFVMCALLVFLRCPSVFELELSTVADLQKKTRIFGTLQVVAQRSYADGPDGEIV